MDKIIIMIFYESTIADLYVINLRFLGELQPSRHPPPYIRH